MTVDQHEQAGLRGAWAALPGVGRAAVVVSLLGFVIRLTFESSETRNGVVVDCSYTDVGALALGAAAVVTGLLTVLAGREAGRRALVIGVGVVAILLGGLHLARGFGAFHDCGSTDGDAAAVAPDTFGPDDVIDRFEDDPGPTTTTAPEPTEDGDSWQAVIGLASTHRDEVMALDLPEGWAVITDGGGTPTRQQLPEATSGDGSIELTGHARGVSAAERADLQAELAAEGYAPSTVGPWEVWGLVDRSGSVAEYHRFYVLAEDLYASLRFSVDPDAPDPTAEIDRIMASFDLG